MGQTRTELDSPLGANGAIGTLLYVNATTLTKLLILHVLLRGSWMFVLFIFNRVSFYSYILYLHNHCHLQNKFKTVIFLCTTCLRIPCSRLAGQSRLLPVAVNMDRVSCLSLFVLTSVVNNRLIAYKLHLLLVFHPSLLVLLLIGIVGMRL